METFRLSIVDQTPRHILCKALVDITIPIATEMKDAIEGLIEQENLRTLLIDLRGVRNIAYAGETYIYIHDTMGQTRYRENTVAMLVDEGDRSHLFAETVFINSGHRTKMFTDLNAALFWIKETQDE